jgi:uncharacterized protein (DUF58 family)
VKPATAVSVALVATGGVAGAPGLVLLGALTFATSWLSTLWGRHGLEHVRYERQFAHDRAVWGDSVDLAITIRNDKALPLAWLEADDFASDELVIRERPLVPSERPGYGILRNVWTLAPFEEVRRHVHLEAVHRGWFAFDTVRLSVADLFGTDVASHEETRRAAFIVRPRTVPVVSARGAIVPLGSRRARTGLTEDPALYAGVRPFQQGDPRRRVHERATARLGRPVSKRFEPSTVRQVLIALDIQTVEGPVWVLAYDDDVVESLAVAAASIARRLLADGAACGIAVNGWTYAPTPTGFVPPRAGRDQLPRIADLLGRTTSVASVPYSGLLAGLPARLSLGTLVFGLGSRDPLSFVPALRRLRSSGFEVRYLALGPRAPTHAAIARRAGIDAIVGRLDPDWRTSDALTLAG